MARGAHTSSTFRPRDLHIRPRGPPSAGARCGPEPVGNADPRHGIREFIVGTGGEALDTANPGTPNLQAWADQYYGVMKLVLYLGAYSWDTSWRWRIRPPRLERGRRTATAGSAAATARRVSAARTERVGAGSEPAPSPPRSCDLDSSAVIVRVGDHRLADQPQNLQAQPDERVGDPRQLNLGPHDRWCAVGDPSPGRGDLNYCASPVNGQALARLALPPGDSVLLTADRAS